MQALALTIVVGLLSGVAIGLQGPLASMMSERVGSLGSAFLVHVGGAALALVLILATADGRLAGWRSIPPYAMWAGFAGVVLIVGISYTIPRIGLAPTFALIITAQLTLGAVVDHFGWLEIAARPLEPVRLAGIAALGIGTALLLR